MISKFFRGLMTRPFRTRATTPFRKRPGGLGRKIEELEDRTTPTNLTYGLFDTGVNAAGVGAADGGVDLHYTLTTSADPSAPGPNAFVSSPLVASWIANSGTSKWLSPAVSGNVGLNAGNYTYHTTFNLTGIDPSTVPVTLTGQFAADNGASILLNGSPVGSVANSFTSYTPFTITSGFVTGVNSLDFVVTNTAAGPTGLRVDGLGLTAPTLTATFDGANNLVIADANSLGSINRITVSSNGTILTATDAVEQFRSAPAGGTLSNGNRTLTIPLTAILGPQVIFNTNAAADVLTVNLAVDIAKVITYNGGTPTVAPGDSLVVTGGSFATGTDTFTNASDGQIVLGANTINYAAIEASDLTGTTIGGLTFNLPAGPSTTFLEDDGIVANGFSRLRSSPATFPQTDFANPTSSLAINRGNAADTLTINAVPDFSAALTVGSVGSPFASATIAGAVTSTGNVSIFANGIATNALLTAGAASTATLSAGTGSIVDGNGAALNVQAGKAALTAAGGVATSADPLELAVANLEGSAGTGFFVTNTGNLIIGGVSGTLNGIATAAGNIAVAVAGNATANEPVVGPGTVNLTATGAASGFTGPYVLQNWTSSGIAGGTTSITPPSGPSATAQFGYNVNLGGGGVSFRTATFSTTAAATGPIPFNYNYAGYHAFFNTNATFQMFANGPGGVTTTLFSGPVGGGFNISGSGTINVNAGFTFGFIIGGSNFDADSRLIGTLTVSNFGPAAAADINLNELVSAGGAANLTATGAIAESGAGRVNTPATLTTSSASGQTLNGANTVAAFNATNSTSGNISLVNAAPTLAITGIGESGGAVSVTNTGSTTIGGTGIASTGNIQTSTTANLTVSSAVASSGGSSALLFGQGGAGNAAVISANITGTSASVAGGAGVDAITVNNTGATTLTVDGAGAGDSYTVNYGSLGTGVVAIADTGVSGTDAALLNGTAAANTFEVNTTAAGGARTVAIGTQKTTYTGSLEQLTIDGKDGADIYNVRFNNGPLPGVFSLIDSGAAGPTDVANLYGTSGADSFNVNSTAGQAAIFGATSERVNYTASLEQLFVNGPSDPGDPTPTAPSTADAGDTFVVTPDASTTITVNGGNPINGFGDTLIANVLGVNNVVITNPGGTLPALPDGKLTSSNRQTLNWTSIETFPVPLGLGGTFDFQTASGSPTQQGFLPLTPGDTAASGAYSFAGVGWLNAGAGAFDRVLTFGAAGNPNSPQLASLLRDGEWGYSGGGSNNGQLQVSVAPNQTLQVSAFIGDTYAPRDNMNVYVGTLASPLATKLNPAITTFNTTGGTSQFVSYSGTFNPGSATAIVITVETAFGGSSAFWTINGVDVRPVGLIAPVALTRTSSSDGAPPFNADGYSIDFYSATGAAPFAEMTINPQYGTPLNGAGVATDADPSVKGFQVVADISGAFTFSIQRPTGTGPSYISVEDVVGSSGIGLVGPTGSGPLATSPNPWVLPNPVIQTYALPTVRRLDFGPTGSAVATSTDPADTRRYISFDTSAYASSAVNALGWIGTAPQTFDRGASFNALQRDGVFANPPSDFELDMPAANTPYSLTALLGDPSFNQFDAYIQVVDAATGTTILSTPASGVNTPAGQSQSITFTATSDGSGRIRLRFGTALTGTNAFWTLQGLEARPVVGSGSPATQLGLTLNGTVYTGAAAVLAGSVAADGTTAMVYSITGATPNAPITVTTSLGTISSSDVGGTYTGIQVLASAGGSASFTIVSPASTSGQVGTISLFETTGARIGLYTQNYTGVVPPPPPAVPPAAVFQAFDFNSGASPTAAGFTGVQPGTIYNTSTGYGWRTAVNGYDRGTGTGGSPTTLFEDGAWGYGSGTFGVGVAPGASRDVRVYVGDPYTAWTGITVRVEGNPTAAAVDPVVDRYGFVTLTGTDGGDGILDITINGGVWVASGVEVATPGNLPAPATGAANVLPGAGRRLEFAASAIAGFTPVSASAPYSAATGFGWAAAVNSFVRPASMFPAGSPLTPTQMQFYGSGAYGSGTSIFEVAVPLNQPTATYSIHAYVSDPYANWNGITLTGEGGATTTLSSSANPPASVTLATVQDLNGDGIITLTVNASIWVLNGIDVIQNPTALPPAP